MSAIAGVLGLQDNDRSYVNVVGQSVVYDASKELLNRYNASLNSALSWFMESTTEDFKRRYKLPGGGYMERRGGQAPTPVRKAYLPVIKPALVGAHTGQT